MNNTKDSNALIQDCIFCTPGKANIIVKQDFAIAAMFPRPFQRAHVVVAPVRHVKSYSDLNTEEILNVGVLCSNVVKNLECLDNVVKVYIVAFGDKDPHFHFHFLPRFKDDPSLGVHAISSKNEWRKNVTKPDESNLKFIYEYLRNDSCIVK